MSLVEHWEMKHPLRAVWNTRYRPGDLLIVQGAQVNTGKKTWRVRIFIFFSLFLFIALPAILGRENFQTVQKMRQQFPSLKHFCGYSGEGRDCRRTGSAFSAHFAFCFSCCESKVCTYEMCSRWMMPSAGSSSLPPEGQEEALQQKVACAERFIYLPV